MSSYDCGCKPKKKKSHCGCHKKRKCHDEKECRRRSVKFVIGFTGSQEVPPVDTVATGAGLAELSKDERCLRFEFDFRNLQSEVKEPELWVGYAHIHDAPAGQNGEIVRKLDKFIKLAKDKKSGFAYGTWTKWDSEPLTCELVDKLLADGLYINIHTKDHPAGEIRAQILRRREPPHDHHKLHFYY